MIKRDSLKTLYIQYKNIKNEEGEDYYCYDTFENYFYNDKTMTLGRILDRKPLKSYKYYCRLAVELWMPVYARTSYHNLRNKGLNNDQILFREYRSKIEVI